MSKVFVLIELVQGCIFTVASFDSKEKAMKNIETIQEMYNYRSWDFNDDDGYSYWVSSDEDIILELREVKIN